MGISAEDRFWIKCYACGKEWSLLLATVCPDCFQRPRKDGSDRMFPEAGEKEE